MDTDEFRKIGHIMIDMIADYLERIEDQALFEEIKRECESVRS